MSGNTSHMFNLSKRYSKSWDSGWRKLSFKCASIIRLEKSANPMLSSNLLRWLEGLGAEVVIFSWISSWMRPPEGPWRTSRSSEWHGDVSLHLVAPDLRWVGGAESTWSIPWRAGKCETFPPTLGSGKLARHPWSLLASWVQSCPVNSTFFVFAPDY